MRDARAQAQARGGRARATAPGGLWTLSKRAASASSTTCRAQRTASGLFPEEVCLYRVARAAITGARLHVLCSTTPHSRAIMQGCIGSYRMRAHERAEVGWRGHGGLAWTVQGILGHAGSALRCGGLAWTVQGILGHAGSALRCGGLAWTVQGILGHAGSALRCGGLAWTVQGILGHAGSALRRASAWSVKRGKRRRQAVNMVG